TASHQQRRVPRQSQGQRAPRIPGGAGDGATGSPGHRWRVGRLRTRALHLAFISHPVCQSSRLDESKTKGATGSHGCSLVRTPELNSSESALYSGGILLQSNRSEGEPAARLDLKYDLLLIP